MAARPPLPPFNEETARQKVRGAEDAWNTRDPAKAVLGYSQDSRWRNRSEFLSGHEAIIAFLTRKWQRELEYRLIKELWAFTGDRIAVRFVYECCDAEGRWLRCHGNENWLIDAEGRTAERHASINDVPIEEGQRLFHWPLGRRPDDHPSLTPLGL